MLTVCSSLFATSKLCILRLVCWIVLVIWDNWDMCGAVLLAKSFLLQSCFVIPLGCRELGWEELCTIRVFHFT